MKFVRDRVRVEYVVKEYIALDIQSLVDLVVVYTQEYNAMLSTGVYDEEHFAQCKRKLARLHAAIKVKGERDGCEMGHISPNLPDDELRVHV